MELAGGLEIGNPIRAEEILDAAGAGLLAVPLGA
jgi:hypothetical protein